MSVNLKFTYALMGVGDLIFTLELHSGNPTLCFFILAILETTARSFLIYSPPQAAQALKGRPLTVRVPVLASEVLASEALDDRCESPSPFMTDSKGMQKPREPPRGLDTRKKPQPQLFEIMPASEGSFTTLDTES